MYLTYFEPPRFFFQAPDLLSVCRQINQEASEYMDQYVVIDMTSSDPRYPGLITFLRLLTAMRARASRFNNVIELAPLSN
jgi:hypothetical protein